MKYLVEAKFVDFASPEPFCYFDTHFRYTADEIIDFIRDRNTLVLINDKLMTLDNYESVTWGNNPNIEFHPSKGETFVENYTQLIDETQDITINVGHTGHWGGLRFSERPLSDLIHNFCFRNLWYSADYSILNPLAEDFIERISEVDRIIEHPSPVGGWGDEYVHVYSNKFVTKVPSSVLHNFFNHHNMKLNQFELTCQNNKITIHDFESIHRKIEGGYQLKNGIRDLLSIIGIDELQFVFTHIDFRKMN